MIKNYPHKWEVIHTYPQQYNILLKISMLY